MLARFFFSREQGLIAPQNRGKDFSSYDFGVLGFWGAARFFAAKSATILGCFGFWGVFCALFFALFVLFTSSANADEFGEFEKIYALKEDFARNKALLANEPSVRAFGAHLEYEKLLKIVSSGKKSEQKKASARLNALKGAEHFELASFYDLPTLDENQISVGNLYEVLEGLSHLRALKKGLSSYEQAAKDSANLSALVEKQYQIAQKLHQKAELDAEYLAQCAAAAEAFSEGSFAISSALENYSIRAKALMDALSGQINAQYRSAVVFVIVIVCIFALRILLARIIRAAVENKDKLYSITKILNIFTTFIITLFSVFYFVENISYLISVLGFASAGLAIAMKDMFMSLLGWCVLQFGAGFHVGDRIRVSKDGSVFVGDIVDISLLKMTIYEDVTLTTYLDNRRAGRLVYIPNNYIFTDLLANYNYSALKSVWDGIDITFSFDSDIDLAREIMLNTAAEHSAALASAAKAAISKMRNHYSMRSSGTDAKIYTMIEPYGIRLSVWYMAPSRETLKARSVISAAIISKITAQKSLKIAYPTQTLYKKEI